MAQSNSSHFARLATGQHSALNTAVSARASPLRPCSGARGMHNSAPALNIALPTLGDTGVKFNSNRWTQAGVDSGISVFDMKGAMETLQKGPEQSSTRRAHPAAIAHAERIARAQQAGVTFYGYKVFPDLTPGRAFMWGSLFSAWAIGATVVLTARALDIRSVDDIKVKTREAFAPYKAALREAGTSARGNVELGEQLPFLDGLHSLGQSVRQQMGAADAVDVRVEEL